MDSIEPRYFFGLQHALGAWCCGLLVACGGGGDGPGAQVAASPVAPAVPAPPAIRDFGLLGAFGGTLTGTNSQDIILVTDAIGNLWAVYGTDAANEFKVAGMLEGISTSTTTRNLSGDAVDSGRDGTAWYGQWQSVQVELSLEPAIPALSGSVTSATDTRLIAGGALPATGYQLSGPATLDAVRGHWDLTTSLGRPLSIDIAADGVISGSSGQCALYDSLLKPSVSGNNVFALVMRFADGSSSCMEPHGGSDGVYGFALAYAPIGGGLQLVIGAANGWDPVHLAAAGKR